ncbi:MAG: hypothetical protein ACPG19_08475 [Saprospiraceae bacterium]
MKRFFRKSSPILAGLLSLLLLSMAFGDVLIQPNKFMTEGGGDGLKNQFTFSSYIKYDKGLHYSRMQYPYGDHIFYSDAQPLIAIPLGWINQNVVSIDHYTVGISNFIMLYSVGFCGFFLFLILKKLKLPDWYSIIFAALIAALSPQIYRFVSHQALGLTVSVPMFWYFLIRFEESVKHKWHWGILVSLLPFILGFFHLYYLPICAFFALSYGFIYTIYFSKSLKTHWKKALAFILMGIIPIVLMKIFIGATVPELANRIKTPYGFFTYTARFESIFLPRLTPFYDLIKNYIKLPFIQFEAHGSVGIIGTLTLLFFIIRWFRFAIKKQFKRLYFFTSQPLLNRYLWSSTLILLFSMAVPFVWGLQWLLEFMPQLKQFRGLGRFNWAFFYPFTVYTAYYIYLIFKRLQHKKVYSFANGFLLTIVLLWGINDYSFLKTVRTYNFNSMRENRFIDKDLPYLDSLAAINFQKNDYQALLALPFFHIGSEKFGVKNSTVAFKEGSYMSYNMGLPLVNTMMSRSSIPQSMNIGQLFSDSVITKSILEDLPNNKPFLAVVYEHPNQPTQPYEDFVINNGEYLTSSNNFHFYKIPLSVFKARTKDIQQRFKSKELLYKKIINDKTYWVSDTSQVFWHNHFDKNKSNNNYIGTGSKFTTKGEKIIFFEGDLPDSTDVSASVWVFVNYLESQPAIKHDVYNAKGELKSSQHIKISNCLNFDNGWVRVDFKIPFYPAGDTHQLSVEGRKHFRLDELMIRPFGLDVFYEAEPDHFGYNNFRIKK